MPIVLTLTEGVIPADQEGAAVERIVDAFLRHHGLAGHAVDGTWTIGGKALTNAELGDAIAGG